MKTWLAVLIEVLVGLTGTFCWGAEDWVTNQTATIETTEVRTNKVVWAGSTNIFLLLKQMDTNTFCGEQLVPMITRASDKSLWDKVNVQNLVDADDKMRTDTFGFPVGGGLEVQYVSRYPISVSVVEKPSDSLFIAFRFKF